MQPQSDQLGCASHAAMGATPRFRPLGSPHAPPTRPPRPPFLAGPPGRRAPLAPAAALPGWLSWLWPFGKKATAAAAPAAAATLSLIDPSQAFTVATVAVLPLYALMIAAPKAKLVGSCVGERLGSCAWERRRQRRQEQERWAHAHTHARARACPPTHTDKHQQTHAPHYQTPPQTRDVVESAAVPLLFAVPYAVLLLQAWQSGALDAVVSAARACAPLPDAAAAAAVFKEPVLTALAWLHLLMLDWIMARWVAVAKQQCIASRAD